MAASFRKTVFSLAIAGMLPSAGRAAIAGKVVDASGQGIAGVTVALRKGKAAAVTAADGSYSLDASPVLPREAWNRPGAPAFRRGALEFRVEAEGRHVSIEAFDPAGKSAGILLEADLPRGTYRVDPFARRPRREGLALLSVRLGTETFSLKLVRTGGVSAASAAPSAPGYPAAGLRKAGAGVLDTLVATKAGYDEARRKLESLSGTQDFLLVKPEEFWGKPSEYPAAKNVMSYVFLNRTNGKFKDEQIYWTFGGQTRTLAEQAVFDMPANSSGRVTFHLESPTGKYWDFMEHTISADAWYGNTTRVDAYGLPLAIRLVCGDGTDVKLGETYEVFYMGRERFFAAYKAAVPAEFQHTADNGAPYRILAPGKGDGGFGPGERYASYYDAYLKELGIAPTDTRKVFACEGTPFGTDAQLAGAVNRHVAHLPKSEWGKAENFYGAAPANFYAKFFHDVGFSEKAYGFAYDDAAGYAAYASCGKPKTLIIAVGY